MSCDFEPTSFTPSHDINQIHQQQELFFSTTTNEILSIELIDSIMKSNPNFITITNNDDYTPLQYSIYHNNIIVVKHIITNYQVDLSYISRINGFNNIHIAIKSNNEQISIEIIDYLMSLLNNDSQQQELLLEHKTDLGDTPLLYAARCNKTIIFQHLMEKYKPNINHNDIYSNNVTHFFVEHDDNIHIIDSICTIAPQLIHTGDFIPLFIAASKNQLKMVQHLVTKYNCNIHHRTSFGWSLLHYSMLLGQSELIDYVIDLDRTLLESKTMENETPLIIAFQVGNKNGFIHLIEKYNVNPFIIDNNYYNLMYHAVDSNKPEMIQIVANAFKTSLYNTPQLSFNNNEDQDEDDDVEDDDDDVGDDDNDDDVEDDDNNNDFPNFTIPNGYPRITGEWLSDDVEIPSPLDYAFITQQIDMVKQLIRIKANITIKNPLFENSGSNSLLHYAYQHFIQNEDYSIFEYLLSNECISDWNHQVLQFHDDKTIQIYGQYDPIQPQLEIRDGQEYTLLLQVAMQHDDIGVELLLKRGANPNPRNDHCHNIFHILFCRDYEPDINRQQRILNIINNIYKNDKIHSQLLLEELSSDGSTPLAYASQFSTFPIIQALIDFNANIDIIRPEVEHNILHQAASNQRYSVIGDLLQHYPQEFQQQLEQLNHYGHIPFLTSLLTIKIIHESQDDNTNNVDEDHDVDQEQQANEEKDDEDENKNQQGEIQSELYDFQNPDITAFIQHDPKQLFFIVPDENHTILHVMIEMVDIELPIRLAGLIEAVIEHVDIIPEF